MNNDEEEIGLLLPFYANGTIGEADRARVTAALEQSPELREELEEIRALQTVVTSGADEWDAQHVPADEARLGNLLERIEQEESAAQAVKAEAAPIAQPRTYRQEQPVRRSAAAPKEERPGLLDWLFKPAWKPAFAAMAMVAGVQGMVLYQNGTPPVDQNGQGSFQTASGPEDGDATPEFSILIRISDTASWADIKAMLEAEGLMIIDGPVDGMLQVAPEGEISQGARKQLIATLSASPLVESAMQVR